MTVNMQNIGNALYCGGMGGGRKSTQEKMERQQKCESQVDFFEKQKENLKNMQCASLEEIARKLEMFHSYEDQIAAAKKQYNNSQMAHVLDEAKEIGDQIAKAAEKLEPKTPEERREEMAEEAAGTEKESNGLLEEIMEEIEETLEETMEKTMEETQEELEEAAKDLDGENQSALDQQAGQIEKLQEEKIQAATFRSDDLCERLARHIDYQV